MRQFVWGALAIFVSLNAGYSLCEEPKHGDSSKRDRVAVRSERVSLGEGDFVFDAPQ